MTTRLKVLHLASFIGNIGDNAMHDGAYRTRSEDMQYDIDYDRMEIREFIHWKTRGFDTSFLREANQYDALIIGGDSLLQMWRDDTPTGTYVDAPPDFFSGISRPICFYGLGVDATRGVSALAMERCRAFLNPMLEDDRRTFSVRDDGSIDLVRKHIGEDVAASFKVISDGGLFCCPRKYDHPCIPAQCDRFVLVNLAGDMPEKRFENETDAMTGFCKNIADGLSQLLQEDESLGCVFVPHIHSDLAIISQTVAFMDDRQRRTRIGVAPYLQGEAWSAGFDLYRHAALVIAMRFHANLVPLGLGVPTIGIDTHHKVGGLYSSMALKEQCVSLSHDTHTDEIFKLAAASLAGGQAELLRRQAEARSQKRSTIREFHQDMQNWLERCV